MTATDAFGRLLYSRLIPEFCSDPSERFEPSLFRGKISSLMEDDARDFLRGWDGGILSHQGRGRYFLASGRIKEQFFWSGKRSFGSRSFTLWLEPIITVAAMARLHFDHGWPLSAIQSQSADWAFDVVAHLPAAHHEHLAGEVKKSRNEVDDLILLMMRYGADPSLPLPERTGKPRNAYKKSAALRARRASIFWAIGPGGYGKVFRVFYQHDASFEFVPVGAEVLRCPGLDCVPVD